MITKDYAIEITNAALNSEIDIENIIEGVITEAAIEGKFEIGLSFRTNYTSIKTDVKYHDEVNRNCIDRSFSERQIKDAIEALRENGFNIRDYHEMVFQAENGRVFNKMFSFIVGWK